MLTAISKFYSIFYTPFLIFMDPLKSQFLWFNLFSMLIISSLKIGPQIGFQKTFFVTLYNSNDRLTSQKNSP